MSGGKEGRSSVLGVATTATSCLTVQDCARVSGEHFRSAKMASPDGRLAAGPHKLRYLQFKHPPTRDCPTSLCAHPHLQLSVRNMNTFTLKSEQPCQSRTQGALGSSQMPPTPWILVLDRSPLGSSSAHPETRSTSAVLVHLPCTVWSHDEVDIVQIPRISSQQFLVKYFSIETPLLSLRTEAGCLVRFQLALLRTNFHRSLLSEYLCSSCPTALCALTFHFF